MSHCFCIKSSVISSIVSLFTSYNLICIHKVNCSITSCHPQKVKCKCKSIQKSFKISIQSVPFSNLVEWLKRLPTVTSGKIKFFFQLLSTREPHNISFCCCQEPKFTQTFYYSWHVETALCLSIPQLQYLYCSLSHRRCWAPLRQH